MRILIVLILAVLMTACVQSPTRNTQVVDDRPSLSFELTSLAAEAYKLRIDGIFYGAVGQYLAGKNALKLIDGTHHVKLLSGEEVVYSKKVYLGAGSTQILKVGNNE